MKTRIVIIGAGVGGLATAMRLCTHGDVTVLEAHGAPGGKMRAVGSPAGPVDAGPTVMTLRPIFEDLFTAAGTQLDEHVTLVKETVLARHHWQDGSSLDLFADPAASEDAVGRFAGAKGLREFRAFCRSAQRLFTAFEGPMMHSAAPSQASLTRQVLGNPGLIPAMVPGLSLAQRLSLSFSDPRLRQLFGRYATYVGGSPYQSPAILGLIWHAEARGVWRVEGGMHRLAQAMAKVTTDAGGTIRYDSHVTRIETQGDRVVAVHTKHERIPADIVVFNGDPKALSEGLLGSASAGAVPEQEPRSLSAFVWSFAAEPRGVMLDHHNVFVAKDPKQEFSALSVGKMPTDATLYVCAQDQGTGTTPTGPERFEIIMNGPPRSGTDPVKEEMDQCHDVTFQTLERMGLSFSPTPTCEVLTTPEMFNALFPASDGSLYGRSPHGMTAAFKRPTARTPLAGLYLAGGGAHPGAGIPMAALSGQHAAAAILSDLTSTSTSPKTAMRGGISTASATTAAARSPSSPS
jgi:1-hydroxycarotenoid 3,4-desaturase